jgi:hypothetical protein
MKMKRILKSKVMWIALAILAPNYWLVRHGHGNGNIETLLHYVLLEQFAVAGVMVVVVVYLIWGDRGSTNQYYDRRAPTVPTNEEALLPLLFRVAAYRLWLFSRWLAPRLWRFLCRVSRWLAPYLRRLLKWSAPHFRGVAHFVWPWPPR